MCEDDRCNEEKEEEKSTRIAKKKTAAKREMWNKDQNQRLAAGTATYRLVVLMTTTIKC